MIKHKIICILSLIMLFASTSVHAENSGPTWSDPGTSGLTQFELALCERDFAQVRRFLSQGADPNAKLTGGGNPLHRACSGNEPRLVTLLLESGSAPNHRDNRGWLPIMWAVSSDDSSPEIVQQLLEKSTDLKPTDLAAILSFHAPSHKLANPAWQASYRKMRGKLDILVKHLDQKNAAPA